MRSSVVLPAPFGPSKPVIDPEGTASETELSGAVCLSEGNSYIGAYALPVDTMFTARYDQSGHFKWAVQGAGNDEEPYELCSEKTTGPSVGRCIAVTPDGRAIVAGTFLGKTVFGEGETNETVLGDVDNDGWDDSFAAIYQPDGSLDWAIRAGGGHWGYGLGMALSPDDAFVLTGFFSGNATFGVDEANQITLHSAGGWDAFAAKYALGSD